MNVDGSLDPLAYALGDMWPFFWPVAGVVLAIMAFLWASRTGGRPVRRGRDTGAILCRACLDAGHRGVLRHDSKPFENLPVCRTHVPARRVDWS